MPDLTRGYPDLKLHLSASAEPVNFHGDEFDLAVPHFRRQRRQPYRPAFAAGRGEGLFQPGLPRASATD
jgi:hypothetical protein